MQIMDALDISLGDLESKWKSYVRDLDSSQIIGLFPFSEEEKNIFLKLTSSINPLDDSTLSKIFLQLFQKYPFSMSIWVASTAAESYANGEFWPTFTAKLGLPNHFKNNNYRESLLKNFRSACDACGFPKYYPRKGQKNFIAAFLFYAGFPICHSQKLAEIISQLNNRNELPNPNEDDAPEILLDLLLEYSSMPITLKRALQSDAGILIAETALNVLSTEDFHKVNKKLGEALKSSFANISLKENVSHSLRPALYLNSELTGFEIHCYKQYDLIEGCDFGWIINGELFRRNSNEDFIYEIPENENEVKVQPQGVRDSFRYARSFDVSRLRNISQEIVFFDANTLKQKGKPIYTKTREVIEVSAGQYWILSTKNVCCENVIDELDFASAKLQRIDIVPGNEVEFKRDDGESFKILSRPSPTILLSNNINVLRTHSGEPIVIKDSCVLDIWDIFYESQAYIKLESNGICEEFPIPFLKNDNGWRFANVDISKFLSLLPDRLCDLHISLIRSGRVKTKRNLLYLKGVSQYDGGNIYFNVIPENIKPERMSGYSLSGNSLKIEENGEPFRNIAFEINRELRFFTFRNKGIFAQIIRRKIGAKDITEKFNLGNEFYVSSSDLSSMRIWNSTEKDVQIFIDKFAETTIPSYSYFDISLSNLADRFPSGGIISTVVDNDSLIISRFRNRPKVEKYTQPTLAEPYHQFEFKHQIKRARITIKNLIDGFSHKFPICVLDSESSIVLNDEYSPVIKIRNYKDTDSVYSKDLFIIEIPESYWEEGIWVINAEVSFSNNGVFERLYINDNILFSAILIQINKDTNNPLLALINEFRAGKYDDIHISPNILPEAISLLNRIRQLSLSNIHEFKKWIQDFEQKCYSYIKYNFKANGDKNYLGYLFQLSEETPSRLLDSMEVFGLDPIYYDSILDTKLVQLFALKACKKIMEFVSVFDMFVLELFNYDFVGCYKGISQEKYDFIDFDLGKYWDMLRKGSVDCNYNLSSFKAMLSKEHWNWAFNKSMQRRYMTTNNLDSIVVVNAYTSRNNDFLVKALRNISKGLLPESIWNYILPRINSEYNIDENMVNFIAIYALACRLVSTGDINFHDWERILDSTGMNNIENGDGEIIKTVFFTYGEVFSFFIIFWETLIKTYKNV